MIGKIFAGLSFSGEEERICKKMAATAQRWPFVKVKNGTFYGSWFGEAVPGSSKSRWRVNESQELIYGKCDSKLDLQREPLEPHSFAIKIVVRPQVGEIQLWSGIGSTPLFYAFDAGNLIIGTDPTLVCAGLECSPKLDPVGIMSFVLLEHPPPTRSLFKQIKRVPPLHRITGGSAGWGEAVSCVEAFISTFPDAGSKSISEAAECLLRAVSAAVHEREDVCLPLTGGVDSRTLLACLRPGDRIRAYTRGAPNDAEVVTATKLAKIAGIPHEAFPFPDGYLEKSFPRVVHLTGGCVPANHSHAIHPLSLLAKQSINTVLPGTNGEFGRAFWPTERFAGLESETDFWNRFFSLTFQVDEQTIRNIFRPPWDAALLSTIGALRNEYAAELPIGGDAPQIDLDWIYLLRRVALFIIWGPYVWNSAFQVTMPFMDFDYLQAVVGLSSWERLGPSVHVVVIKLGKPPLLRMPLVPSGRLLQPKIGERWRAHWRLKKASLMGISHRYPQKYDQWLRREAVFVESVLFSNYAFDRGLFHLEGIQKLWRDHMSGGNHASTLCKLLTLELACRINLDGMSITWDQP